LRKRFNASPALPNRENSGLETGKPLKNSETSFRPAAILMAAVLFFAACAQMPVRRPGPGMPETEDVRAMGAAAELDRLNQELLSFSGVGQLTVKRKGQVRLRERVAWIGAAPDRLSMVVFISGFPGVRVATDGQWVYIIEPRENKPVFRQVRASDASLAHITGIEISFEDIVELLRGRIPLSDFRTALLTPEGDDRQNELALKKWWGTFQKITLEADDSQPLAMIRYDRSGKMRYQAVFEETQRVGGFRVPQRLRILNGEDAEFSLSMDRYLPNVDVSADQFVLEPIQ
jgi:hypothetical protein